MSKRVSSVRYRYSGHVTRSRPSFCKENKLSNGRQGKSVKSSTRRFHWLNALKSDALLSQMNGSSRKVKLSRLFALLKAGYNTLKWNERRCVSSNNPVKYDRACTVEVSVKPGTRKNRSFICEVCTGWLGEKAKYWALRVVEVNKKTNLQIREWFKVTVKREFSIRAELVTGDLRSFTCLAAETSASQGSCWRITW